MGEGDKLSQRCLWMYVFGMLESSVTAADNDASVTPWGRMWHLNSHGEDVRE